MTLQRKTPLRRGGFLKTRSTLSRSARIKPESETKRGQRDHQRAVREEVFARDGWRCRLAVVPGAGRCFGELTYGHRRNAAQGGAYSVVNGCAECAGHNDRLEADAEFRAAARALGLVVRRGDPDWSLCG